MFEVGDLLWRTTDPMIGIITDNYAGGFLIKWYILANEHRKSKWGHVAYWSNKNIKNECIKL